MHRRDDAARLFRQSDAYPFLYHAQIEPMNCTARFEGGKLELSAPIQDPQNGAPDGAKKLGISESDITIHLMRMGGAFGRRHTSDFVLEAAVIARQAGVLVKLLWTREDVVQHGVYRPAGWGRRRLAPRTGMGIAFPYSHRGYFAEVVEASVSDAGAVTVSGVWVAGDIGRPIINPNGAIGQVQGAVLDRLSCAMSQEITLEGGKVVQSNVNDGRLITTVYNLRSVSRRMRDWIRLTAS